MRHKIKRLLAKTANFFTDLLFIVSPNYRLPRRRELLLTYCKLSCKYFLSRWFSFSHERFLSYRVTVADYALFYEIFRQIFVRQSYYFETQNKSPFIIDGGGNMGMSLLYFKYRYPDAEVIVFEPSKNILPILKQNITDNKIARVTLVESALSDIDGTHVFYDRGVGACGDTLIESLLVGSKADAAAIPVEVKTKRLSPFITKPVDFLKLDIEGSEGAVIKELAEAAKLTEIQSIGLEYHYYPQNTANELSLLLERLVKAGHHYQVFLEQITPATGVQLIRHDNYYCLLKTILRK